MQSLPQLLLTSQKYWYNYSTICHGLPGTPESLCILLSSNSFSVQSECYRVKMGFIAINIFLMTLSQCLFDSDKNQTDIRPLCGNALNPCLVSQVL